MSIHEQFEIADKTILLTGGASRYGKPVAADLASAGATVIITSREHERACDVVDSMDPGNGTLYPAQLDLSETASIEKLMQKIRGEFDALEGLVNNAVARPMSTLEDDLEGWEHSIQANATGVFELTRRVAEWMCDSGGGSIVNVGSIQGMVGPDVTLYEGTEMYNGGDQVPAPDYFFHKGGLLNLTRYFASAYGRDSIRVNYVALGGIKNEQDEAFVESYRRRTMLGRMARGEDLSGTILFLLSEASSYITGANIPVDGGYTSK
jgi:NAD(P)-dependent dehydrogenase (short-subunit alcohol dehydrogenase family)